MRDLANTQQLERATALLARSDGLHSSWAVVAPCYGLVDLKLKQSVKARPMLLRGPLKIRIFGVEPLFGATMKDALFPLRQCKCARVTAVPSSPTPNKNSLMAMRRRHHGLSKFVVVCAYETLQLWTECVLPDMEGH